MMNYNDSDIIDVFNSFTDTYAKIVDYFNTYFVGEKTKIDYDTVCTTNGINMSPLINVFTEIVDRHNNVETFIKEMKATLNDPNDKYHNDYKLLVYYINMAHRLERDLWLSLESIRRSEIVNTIATNNDMDVNNADTIAELVRIGIHTLDSLRELMYNTINYGFFIYLTGLIDIGSRPSSLKRLSDNDFFYKEIKPVLTGIFSYTGTLIIETPLMYYDRELLIGVKLKRYTIFFGSSSRLATVMSITYIEDSGGHPVNDFQIVSIDDFSYFRTTIGHIIPDHFRCIMGMGHAKYVLDKSKIKSYLKNIISKVCDSDEEIEMIIDTCYSFDTLHKMDIFEDYIKKYRDRIEFTINELESIRKVNGEFVMDEEPVSLQLILNRPDLYEDYIKPLEECD